MDALIRAISDYDFPVGYIAHMVKKVRADGEALSDHRDRVFAQAGEEWLAAMIHPEAKPEAEPEAKSEPKPAKGWAAMTPEERSAEITRRWTVRKANAAKPDDEPPTPPKGRKKRKPKPKPSTDPKVVAHRKAEVYRTPRSAFTPLMDYRPEWFNGIGFDPSAGDGRMIAEVIDRGNPGPHHLVEVRPDEWPKLARFGDVTIADYLSIENPAPADFLITNPPFSLTDQFVEKARTHVRGAIMMLQQSAWGNAKTRSKRLKEAGLSHILNLRTRPKFEMDHGAEPPGRFFGFAWFVFQPGYTGEVITDWLDDELIEVAA